MHGIREREVAVAHGCESTTPCPNKRHSGATARLDGPPLSNPLSNSRRVRPSPLEIDPLIKLAMVTATEALMSAGMSGVSELTLGKRPSLLY